MDQEETKGINFDLPKNRSNVIKVLGVGGGGSNAINYMFQQGIKGVDFIVSNTDAQALAESGVPTKIQLGASLTEGLGAGANPEVGASAALESQEEIQSILSTQTKMIFITAGMGGGTGTGAAPVIAQMAKSLDILTVGIITMPFQFEGKLRLEQAQRGLEKIKTSVDALIVINNNKLREVYGNLGFKAGFAKADEVLATAARGIAEVITHHYTQNIDLKDAKTVLTNSGTAIMGSGLASGSNRAQEAIVKALDSPLLNDNKITGCKNVLLLIVSGSDEITIDEIGEINDFIQAEAGNHTNIIMGVGEDESLGNEVSVTVIATGFGQEQQNEISNTEAKKIIHTLEADQKITHDLSDKNPAYGLNNSYKTHDLERQNTSATPNKINQSIEEVSGELLIEMNTILYDLDVDYEVVSNNIDFQGTNEIPVEEESETSSVENTYIPKHEEIKAEKIVDKKVSEIDEINLENSFFEHQFELDSTAIENIPLSFNVNISDESLDEEFIINDLTDVLSDIDVVDPEVLDQESQIQLDFELPLNKVKTEDFQTKHLEEGKLLETSGDLTKDFEEASLEVTFEIKDETSDTEKLIIKENDSKSNSTAEIDHFEQSINESITSQSEKRREHLKAFNYKFKHQLQRIDEIEKEPAYKRQGINLDGDKPDLPSRTSLSNDENNDLQLRSNNSFLHDNVD
jgi:cell division protein FtsZ